MHELLELRQRDLALPSRGLEDCLALALDRSQHRLSLGGGLAQDGNALIGQEGEGFEPLAAGTVAQQLALGGDGREDELSLGGHHLGDPVDLARNRGGTGERGIDLVLGQAAVPGPGILGCPEGGASPR